MVIAMGKGMETKITEKIQKGIYHKLFRTLGKVQMDRVRDLQEQGKWSMLILVDFLQVSFKHLIIF
jgi:hypothetical protein